VAGAFCRPAAPAEVPPPERQRTAARATIGLRFPWDTTITVYGSVSEREPPAQLNFTGGVGARYVAKIPGEIVARHRSEIPPVKRVEEVSPESQDIALAERCLRCSVRSRGACRRATGTRPGKEFRGTSTNMRWKGRSRCITTTWHRP
jgi:hypothetical protein